VPVVSSLISEEQRGAFAIKNREEQDRLRATHSGTRQTLIPLDEARARRTPIAWRAEDIAQPEFIGVRTLENFPLETLREFIDYAKARPGKVNFINGGGGTSQTMSTELLQRNTGIDLVGIGYKGFPPAIPDILAGQVQFAFIPFGVAAPHIRSSKLRALAIAAPARSKMFPEVPTMAEAGYAESQVVSWYALLAPAATPRAAVARLNAEFGKALADSEVLARIDRIGGEPLPAGKPEEVDAMLARELERWTKLVQTTGMKMD
jgi:tripartite-type tricarboxylate transporter receptor subunit TctC